jgi:predicted permease
LGRLLRPDDDARGATLVAVISHGLWHRLFGGDSAVIGAGLDLAERRYTIVGVAPEGLEYPRGAEVWFPVRPFWNQDEARLQVDLLGRLASGVTPEAARNELDGILRQLDQESPEHRDQNIVARPIADVILGDVRPALWMLSLAVGLILLIAGVNLAILLTIRGIGRRQELAVRASLGAGRDRVLRQLLAESVLLGLAGGALGLAFAQWGLDALLAFAPSELPRLSQVGLNGRVFALAGGTSVLAAGVFGLAPALGAARARPALLLRDAGRVAGARVPRGPWEVLVASQVALTLVMLIGAGLLVRSVARLAALDPGFDTERLVLARIAVPPSKYRTAAEAQAVFDRLRERAAAIPGVLAATTILNTPFSGTSGHDIVFTTEGQDLSEAQANPWLNYEGVDPSYFETIGLPILAGRPLTEADRHGGAAVVVVNQVMARRLWGDDDAIGRRLKFGGFASTDPWRTVVGVAGNARYRELTDVRPSVFVPYEQGIPAFPCCLALRTHGPGITPPLRQVLAEVDPGVVLLMATPVDRLLDAPLAQPRFNSTLVGLLAGLGLLLSAVGVYGVIAYAVASRTHEIGVRMALGARAADVVWLVLGQVARPCLAGMAVGIVAALAGTRLLAGLLYEVSPTDAVSFVVGPLTIMVVALLSAGVPARRAARVAPMEALRHD